MLMGLPNLDGSFTMTLYLPKTGSTNSFSAIQSAEDVQDFFKREFGSAIPLMPNYVSEFLQNPQGSLGTLTLNNWIFQDNLSFCFLDINISIN
jgi:kynurenine 3-monooxygenase